LPPDRWTHLATRHQGPDEGHEEEDDEEEEEDAAMSDAPAAMLPESEDRGNDRDDEEAQSPSKHGRTPKKRFRS
jgi:hypothetical protein